MKRTGGTDDEDVEAGFGELPDTRNSDVSSSSSSHENDSRLKAVAAIARREMPAETHRPRRPKTQAETRVAKVAKGSRNRTDRAASLVDGCTRRKSRQPKTLTAAGS